jgi:hypothetical protein
MEVVIIAGSIQIYKKEGSKHIFSDNQQKIQAHQQ